MPQPTPARRIRARFAGLVATCALAAALGAPGAALAASPEDDETRYAPRTDDAVDTAGPENPSSSAKGGESERGSTAAVGATGKDKQVAAEAGQDEPARSEPQGERDGGKANADDAGPRRSSDGSGSEGGKPNGAGRSAGGGSREADETTREASSELDRRLAAAERRIEERTAAAGRTADQRIETRLRVLSPGGDRSSDEPAAEPGRGGGEQNAQATVSIAAERIQLLPGRRHVLRYSRALVRGYIPSRRSGRTVVLEVRSGGAWREVDRDVTGDGGKFYTAWYPRVLGHYRVRARELNNSSVYPSHARLLYIYRKAMASWYGPGFYGNRTACGQTFTSRLMGVANRTLPCGYRVTVRYGDRAVTVPVVDRGPYVRGRDWDLTEATKNHLRFSGVDEVWTTA